MISVNILGSIWTIEEKSIEADNTLDGIDGYADSSLKKIVIRDKNNDVGSWNDRKKHVLRHEIIHAFMFESGLDSNWEHSSTYGHDETTVDWFAIQWPKIQMVFDDLKIAE